MHGLIFRTFQVFVQDTYGPDTWGEIAERADLDVPDFEAMLIYPRETCETVLKATQAVLKKPVEAFLEDVGTYLVSHPNSEALRRLLRFGGVDFIEFLYSLEDLPDRARLAVSDLELPDLELLDPAPTRFQLKVSGDLPGFGYVMLGVLRAIADDYGALVLMDCDQGTSLGQTVEITVIETAFAEGREFDLGASTVSGGQS